MSMPQPGTYVIYNRVLSPSGDKLAITFNGKDINATVTPLSYGGPQKWVIVNFSDGKTQSVSPRTNPSLQAAWGKNAVPVLPAGGYVWTIRSSDGGYTIKDGGVTVNWGIDNATSGANITIAVDTCNEKQRWIFEHI